MMDIVVPIIVLTGGLILASWIIYNIGYSAGYQDGGNKALDNVADRTERRRRSI